jgi:hypothetical protein
MGTRRTLRGAGWFTAAVCAALVGACARRAAAPPAAKAAPTPAAMPGTPASPAHAADAGYDWKPAERAAVDAFLRAHPDLRVATDADHRVPDAGDGLEGMYGTYHPYFVRGDDNDDGILDFLLAFVRRDSDRDTPWFSVVSFEGRPDGSFDGGVFLERDISLVEGDLAVDRDAIVVTPDVSEDLARRYRWDPAKQRHVFVRDDDTGDSSPSSPSRI